MSAAGVSHRAALLAPLHRCARGETPPNVALMHLLREATSPTEAEAALAHVSGLAGGTAIGSGPSATCGA